MSNQTRQETPRICSKMQFAAGILIGLLACSQAGARNANDQLCLPTTVWYGGAAPDVTKGFVPTDPGWLGAFRYRFDNGTTTPDVVVEGVRDGSNSNLYIGVQVNNLMNFDPYSAVVIAVDPDGTNSNKQLLVISPIQAGASPTNLNPSTPTEVDYYRGWDPTTGWGSVSSTTTTPAWAQIFTNYASGGATAFQWNMAAKFAIDPTGNSGIAANTNFGLYFNVLPIPNEPPTAAPGTQPAVPFAWPRDAPALAGGAICDDPQACPFTLANTLPDASKWGNSTVNPTSACQGVSISSQVGNIYTNHGTAVYNGANEPVISRVPGDQNIFSAYVQNTMVDTGGNALVAKGIRATFKIANFGLPSYASWAVPGSEAGGSPIAGDPTLGQDIPATGCTLATNNNSPACTISTGAWTLNTQEIADYGQAVAQHQCVEVEIDAAPGSGALILSNTAAQNMNFEPGSSVQRVAEISAKGYPLAHGMSDQFFDLGVVSRSEVLHSKPDASVNRGGAVSQLTWEIHGCRHTNKFILIREKRIELCESVGSFGLIVHHAASNPVLGWIQDLTGGTNLEKVKGRDNLYRIHIVKDGVSQVSTHIVPIDTGICTKLRGGAMYLYPTGVVLIGAVLYWPRRKKRTPAGAEGE